MDVSLSPMRPVLAENLRFLFTPFVNHRVEHFLKDFHCPHLVEEDSPFCVTKVQNFLLISSLLFLILKTKFIKQSQLSNRFFFLDVLILEVHFRQQ